jgi:hypothetical protein
MLGLGVQEIIMLALLALLGLGAVAVILLVVRGSASGGRERPRGD